jgi:hypothetical protein
VPITSNGEVVIQTPNGVVAVADIRTLPEVADVSMGMYHTNASKTSNIDGFEILYSSTDGTFSISIEKKPLNVYREKASLYFLQLFKVTQLDACKLNVFVGIPAEVDRELAGQSLGLSFCPGSVTLP